MCGIWIIGSLAVVFVVSVPSVNGALDLQYEGSYDLPRGIVKSCGWRGAKTRRILGALTSSGTGFPQGKDTPHGKEYRK